MEDSEGVIDDEIYNRLKSVIEILTHSGLRILDENLFKEVKKLCRSSPATTRKTYFLILYQLKKEHSEIRYISFQMCIELFKWSSLFRKLILKDLRLIFELTMDTNPKKRLPPPKTVAKMLETLALSTVKRWYDDYGKIHQELRNAIWYLKHVKKVNFNLMLANNEVEEQRKRREKLLKKEKLKILTKEIDNYESEIENTIMALTNCLSLIVPSPDDFFINEDKDDLSSTNSEDFQTKYSFSDSKTLNPDGNDLNLKQFGITTNYSISVRPNLENKIKVAKTEENSSLIQNAEDNVKLIKNRYLPLIKKWNKACATCSSRNGDIIKRILNMKEKLENCIKKFDELDFLNDCNNQINESDSDENDDFEEVTKEGYESNAFEFENFDFAGTKQVPPTCKKTETEWKISTGEVDDPTSAMSTIKKLKELAKKSAAPAAETSASTSDSLGDDNTQKKMSRKDRLLACAPKLPFDIDLYHWEDENLTAPTLLSVKMDSPKFWGATSVDDMDEIPNPEGLAALRTRVIEFSGKFEPVKWSCRAPLPNGKLCPRKDRFKCPFHGKIVPRDDNGVCTDESSTNDDKQKTNSDWQDPELLEDIKIATGVDLKMPNKRERKEKEKISKTHKVMGTSSLALKEIKERNFPGLTDTFGKQDNARNRLAKKIFNRSSLNKVAGTLNKIDFSKHRDKFGDQFNYMFDA